MRQRKDQLASLRGCRKCTSATRSATASTLEVLSATMLRASRGAATCGAHEGCSTHGWAAARPDQWVGRSLAGVQMHQVALRIHSMLTPAGVGASSSPTKRTSTSALQPSVSCVPPATALDRHVPTLPILNMLPCCPLPGHTA